MAGGRFRQIVKKYGKVALGVHCSVSAVSITGLFIAIKNNVDVESVLDKFHVGGVSPKDDDHKPTIPFREADGSAVLNETPASAPMTQEKTRNRTAELAASSGGAFALALLCNKALFPIRVPITIALTPPIARFLAKRNIIKAGF
ncbi:uncharacterized protein LOC129287116 [Prosopis cineraria]|uniref:uncharacterized protein LOC129287116 n=1 Tax=Prosopis cineraria TaxID=364024 RepID=UPI00240FCE20|nr:uncharacterized protein LOC129287116 [Prosopis cineraria]